MIGPKRKASCSQSRRRRYVDGLTPVCWRKVVVKWLSELNPTRWQIWVIVYSESSRSSLARWIRRPIR